MLQRFQYQPLPSAPTYTGGQAAYDIRNYPARESRIAAVPQSGPTFNYQGNDFPITGAHMQYNNLAPGFNETLMTPGTYHASDGVRGPDYGTDTMYAVGERNGDNMMNEQEYGNRFGRVGNTDNMGNRMPANQLFQSGYTSGSIPNPQPPQPPVQPQMPAPQPQGMNPYIPMMAMQASQQSMQAANQNRPPVQFQGQSNSSAPTPLTNTRPDSWI
jgi:hypothetical protein